MSVTRTVHMAVVLVKVPKHLSYSTFPGAKIPSYVEAVLTKVVTQDTTSTLNLHK